jgi:hypothetical protein
LHGTLHFQRRAQRIGVPDLLLDAVQAGVQVYVSHWGLQIKVERVFFFVNKKEAKKTLIF